LNHLQPPVMMMWKNNNVWEIFTIIFPTSVCYLTWHSSKSINGRRRLLCCTKKKVFLLLNKLSWIFAVYNPVLLCRSRNPKNYKTIYLNNVTND
jgi:hypothetical protein